VLYNIEQKITGLYGYKIYVIGVGNSVEKIIKDMIKNQIIDIGHLPADKNILNLDKIKQLLEETDVLFLTFGIGSKKGVEAAQIISEIAETLGIFTILIVTTPFSFENKTRIENAKSGIEKLKKSVNSLIIIPSNRLTELLEKPVTLENAFVEINNILKFEIKKLTDLFLKPGLINLKITDLKEIMRNSTKVMIGFGSFQGENRAIKAVEKALQNPLLENSIFSANRILMSITGSSNLGLNEVLIIADRVDKAVRESIDNVMFGVINDDGMGDRIEVMLVAINVDSGI